MGAHKIKQDIITRILDRELSEYNPGIRDTEHFELLDDLAGDIGITTEETHEAYEQLESYSGIMIAGLLFKSNDGYMVNFREAVGTIAELGITKAQTIREAMASVPIGMNEEPIPISSLSFEQQDAINDLLYAKPTKDDHTGEEKLGWRI